MQRKIHRFFLLFSLLAALSAGCGKRADKDGGGGPPTTNGPQKEGSKDATGTHHPALEVRDTLALDLAADVSPSEAARRLDALATTEGGFVEESSVNALDARATQGSGVEGDETSAHVVLRLPPSRLEALRATLASMRKDGTNTRETMTAKDVGDALADLDARLNAARTEEARLLRLLDDKTAALADVLAVERALSDVRDRVERLEAEQRVSQGRVDLATVDVWLRSSSADPSIASRMTSAGRDGLRMARDATLGATMLFLRVGPTLALFAFFVAIPLFALRRRRRTTISVS